MKDYRVLVTGSQLWTDKKYIFEELDWEFEEHFLATDCGKFVVVQGKCPNGADAHAREWANLRKSEGLPVDFEDHPADWKGPRKRGAGYARNAEMVKLGADRCHAFILNESKGSTHCAGLAEKAGIPTQIHRRESPVETAQSNTLEVRRTQLARRDITLKNVQIIYKNFEGRPDTFNPDGGKRSFHVLLDPASADVLEAQGYNVKRKPALEKGGEEFIHLKVVVSFKGRPPTVALISRNKGTRNTLDGDTVELADHADFERIDLTISPYDWKKGGNSGRTAYLQEFFGFLYESPLEKLYGHYIEESEQEALQIPQDLEFDDEGVVSDTGWEQEGDQRAIEG